MNRLATRLLAAALAIAPALPLALPAPAVAQSRDGGYVVQQGDTLGAIARALGVDLDQLLGANPGLSERDLQPGRRIDFGDVRRDDRDRRGPVRARVSVDDRDAVPGGTALVRIEGLPPRLEVSVEARGERSGTEGEARASRNGSAVVELDVPNRARPGERFEVEVYGPRDDVIGQARFRVAGDEGRDRPLRLSGVLTGDGLCPTIRTDRGERYTLYGAPRDVRRGDEVEITGTPMRGSPCRSADTIRVDRFDYAR